MSLGYDDSGYEIYDAEKIKKSSVITAHTVCLPLSSSPVEQQPSR